MADGSPLYMSVCKGNSYVFPDAAHQSDLTFQRQGPGSLVCITIHWSNKAYGCAFFGSRRPDANIASRFPVLQVFCNQVGISLRNAMLYKELKSRNVELSSLYEVSRVLLGTLDYKEVMQTILVNAKKLVNAESCFIYELDPVHNMLRCISSVSEPPVNIEKLELPIGEGYTGIVAELGKGLLIERTDMDQRGSLIEGTASEPRSVISVPLSFSGKLIGVMTLSKKLGTPFNQKQYDLIALFSLKAALAVQNAYIYEKVRSYASSLQMYNCPVDP